MCRQGDAAESLYIIISGRLRLVQENSQNSPVLFIVEEEVHFCPDTLLTFTQCSAGSACRHRLARLRVVCAVCGNLP